MFRVLHGTAIQNNINIHTARALLLMSACAATPAWAAGYVGAETGVSAGDFGTGNTATLYSVNFSSGIVAQRYDASVIVPILHLRDDEGLSETGIGDVLVRGGFGFLRSGGWTGDLALAVKLPTADETKNLGTGETDLGGFVDVGWQADATKISIGLSYLAVGDPPDINYDNIVSWNISVFTRVDQFVGLQAALRGQTSMFTDSDDPLDVSLSGFYAFNSNYAATFSGSIGLSDGSPDAGLSIGVVRWF